jgi:hypothetical protein
MRHVLLISFVALALASCRKEYCWQCETAITTTVVSAAHDSTTIESARQDVLCSRSTDEIRDDEKKNASDSTWQEGSSTVRRLVRMSCTK